MSKYTPGPWTVFRCQFAYAEPNQACGLNGKTFDASYDECHHTIKLADARLIAAAPDLLEALKKCREIISDEWGKHLNCTADTICHEWCHAFRDADSAIKKAEGKQ